VGEGPCSSEGGGRDKGGGSDWFVSLRVCVVDEHVINKERIYSCTPMYTRNNMCGERERDVEGGMGMYIYDRAMCVYAYDAFIYL